MLTFDQVVFLLDAGNILLASHRVAVDPGARPERGSGADDGSWPGRRPGNRAYRRSA